MHNQGPKYKIFPSRGGMETIPISQGRNVQPFLFQKKAEIQVERGINSPFEPYSIYGVSNESSLAHS